MCGKDVTNKKEGKCGWSWAVQLGFRERADGHIRRVTRPLLGGEEKEESGIDRVGIKPADWSGGHSLSCVRRQTK